MLAFKLANIYAYAGRGSKHCLNSGKRPYYGRDDGDIIKLAQYRIRYQTHYDIRTGCAIVATVIIILRVNFVRHQISIFCAAKINNSFVYVDQFKMT